MEGKTSDQTIIELLNTINAEIDPGIQILT